MAAKTRRTIVRAMGPLALALHLVLASPGLSAPVDPGPFQGAELAAASIGAFGGDLLVVGAGYATLKLFANGTIEPNAANFRTAAYALGVSALLVPPLTGVLFAKLARTGPASGAVWKALLLASAGQAAALAAGYFASPHLWVVLPVQFVTIAVGTSFGLHWGPRPREQLAPTRIPAIGSDPEPSAPPGAAAALAPRYCPDPALLPHPVARAG